MFRSFAVRLDACTPVLLACAYLVWYPLLWLLGLDQILIYPLSLLVFVAAVRFNRGRLKLKKIDWLVLAWVLSPVISLVNVANFGVYFKIQASLLAFFFIYIGLRNSEPPTSPRISREVVKALWLTAAYSGVATALYLIGFRESFTTIVGFLVPNVDSFFWSSIKFHSLGDFVSLADSSFGFRVKGLFSSYTNMTFALIAAMPFLVLGRLATESKVMRGNIVLFFGCWLAMILTDSRYSTMIGGVLVVVCLVFRAKLLRKLSRRQAVVVLSIVLFSVMATLGVIAFLSLEAILFLFTEHRATSSGTRFMIYTESLAYIAASPFIGYGHPVPIEGYKSIYALGTHSSIIGVAFQFGVLSLCLYLALIFALLSATFRNVVTHHGSERVLYIMLGLAYCGVLLRELADIWWWDSPIIIIYALLFYGITTKRLGKSLAEGV